MCAMDLEDLEKFLPKLEDRFLKKKHYEVAKRFSREVYTEQMQRLSAINAVAASQIVSGDPLSELEIYYRTAATYDLLVPLLQAKTEMEIELLKEGICLPADDEEIIPPSAEVRMEECVRELRVCKKASLFSLYVYPIVDVMVTKYDRAAYYSILHGNGREEEMLKEKKFRDKITREMYTSYESAASVEEITVDIAKQLIEYFFDFKEVVESAPHMEFEPVDLPDKAMLNKFYDAFIKMEKHRLKAIFK